MHIRTNKRLNVLFRPLIIFCEWLGTYYPKTLARIRYYFRFKKPLSLNNPQTLNEKILFLSLRTDTSLWTKCADKYEVRDYVKECGLEDILIPLYGVWEHAEDIDFTSLPNEFVMKGTHGCDDVLIVKDKNELNIPEVVASFRKDLSKKYGALESGHHYLRIKPRIIAEELIKNDAETAKISSSIIDFKIWCFNGKASFIWVSTNRRSEKDGERKETMVYDRQWQPHPDYLIYDKGYIKSSGLPKPKNFEAMIEAAEKLSKPFPEVRCDLYNINGRIYFGELTFTGYGGLMTHYTEEFQKIAGSMIDLSGCKTIN